MPDKRTILTCLLTIAVAAAGTLRFDAARAVDAKGKNSVAHGSLTYPLHPSFDRSMRGFEVWRLVFGPERIQIGNSGWSEVAQQQALLATSLGGRACLSAGDSSLQALSVKLQV